MSSISWCAISRNVSSPSFTQSPTAKHHCVSVPCSSSPWSLRQRPYSHQSSHVSGEGEGLRTGEATERLAGGTAEGGWLSSPSPRVAEGGPRPSAPAAGLP